MRSRIARNPLNRWTQSLVARKPNVVRGWAYEHRELDWMPTPSLDAIVPVVGDEDLPSGIHGNAGWVVELAFANALRPEDAQEASA
jgi:hypothetical protein